MTEIMEFDIGDAVICDNCGKDYTSSNEEGGVLFCTKAYCPECVPSLLDSVNKYKEQKYIGAVAEPGETFREFVLRIRNGNNTVKIVTDDNPVWFKYFC